MNFGSVENATAGLQLAVPRTPHRGRAGDSRASSSGSSMELHDFRAYQPGDDLRHVDWNAVARTGEMVLRLRQEEVTPTFELFLDTSASMAVSSAKATRSVELAYGFCRLAANAGLEVSLVATARRVALPEVQNALSSLAFDGRASFDVAMGGLPPPRPSGIRVLVSDLLFEAEPKTLVERLARNTAQLIVCQVLDQNDLAPSFTGGARLVDSESAASVDRTLTADDLAAYDERLSTHVAMWRAAVTRVRGAWVQLNAAKSLTELLRGDLAPLVTTTS